MPLHAHSSSFTVWPRIANIQKKDLSVVSPHCELGDKVTFKQCSFANGVKIGARSKLNNVIVMENVVIGDNCTIQNTVICADAVIESNCNLNECSVGTSAKVSTGTKLKGESITNATM